MDIAMARAPDGTVYEVHGPADAPAVVLIHGLGLNRKIWQWLIPALAGRYRVLSYDLQGHGQSPPPTTAPNLAGLARQLADLMDACATPKAAIVGFSLGGMIARRFAQDYPARCQALAILHSAHRRSPKAQATVEFRVEQAKAEGPGVTVEPALLRWFTDGWRAAHPQAMDQMRGWLLGNDRASYPSFYAILAHGVAELIAPRPPISCPALVMTGDEDFGNGPEMTRAIADEIAGAEVVILPGLRHMALMEDPGSTNSVLLGFLDRLQAEGALD